MMLIDYPGLEDDTLTRPPELPVRKNAGLHHFSYYLFNMCPCVGAVGTGQRWPAGS